MSNKFYCAQCALWLAFGIQASANGPVYTTIYSFTGGADGDGPLAALSVGRGGVLYGTTYKGGAYGYGTVFALMPPTATGGIWTESVLWSFGGTLDDGRNPTATLLVAANGTLYGTTRYGGFDTVGGTVFSLTPPSTPEQSWTENLLHIFRSAGAQDGIQPYSGVVMDGNGVLYGTTYNGGAQACGSTPTPCGVAYSLTPPSSPGAQWTEAILWNFGGLGDGVGPASNLLLGSGGVLYGTTLIGGSYGDCGRAGTCSGTVFSLTPPTPTGLPWTEAILWNFGAAGGGSSPNGLLLENGALFGTNQYGGGKGNPIKKNLLGDIFALMPPAQQGASWTETAVHKFRRTGVHPFRYGCYPNSGLEPEGKRGKLYGTTGACGDGWGTIYELTPPTTAGAAWTIRLLHTFSAAENEPVGGLVAGPDGALYGVSSGGAGGTVFSIVP